MCVLLSHQQAGLCHIEVLVAGFLQVSAQMPYTGINSDVTLPYLIREPSTSLQTCLMSRFLDWQRRMFGSKKFGRLVVGNLSVISAGVASKSGAATSLDLTLVS